jgi:hypothetical protein
MTTSGNGRSTRRQTGSGAVAVFCADGGGGLGARGRFGELELADVGQEAIAAPRDRLDEARGRGRILQGLTDLFDCHVERGIEVDERVLGPDRPAQVVAADQLAGMAHELTEDLRWLALQGYAPAVPTQLSGSRIELEGAEPNDRALCTHRTSGAVSPESITPINHAVQLADPTEDLD